MRTVYTTDPKTGRRYGPYTYTDGGGGGGGGSRAAAKTRVGKGITSVLGEVGAVTKGIASIVGDVSGSVSAVNRTMKNSRNIYNMSSKFKSKVTTYARGRKMRKQAKRNDTPEQTSIVRSKIN